MLLSQQRVDLLYKLQSRVLLIQNERVNRVQLDWHFAPIKKELELGPIVALASVVLSVGEGVHRDVSREVAREDLCDKESIVEGASHIFD